MNINSVISYKECPCVDLAKEFHMTVLCQKCWGSRKFVTINEKYHDVFFVCHICEGSGQTCEGICKRCNGKGYLDWVGEVIR